MRQRFGRRRHVAPQGSESAASSWAEALGRPSPIGDYDNLELERTLLRWGVAVVRIELTNALAIRRRNAQAGKPWQAKEGGKGNRWPSNDVQTGSRAQCLASHGDFASMGAMAVDLRSPKGGPSRVRSSWSVVHEGIQGLRGDEIDRKGSRKA